LQASVAESILITGGDGSNFCRREKQKAEPVAVRL
jgi:hypothetical protein